MIKLFTCETHRDLIEMIENLPQDIINYIHEFSANHRDNHNGSLKRIPLYYNFQQIHISGIKNRIENVLKICDKSVTEHAFWDFESIFNDNCSDLEYFVDVLSNCRCCNRHIINRPHFFNKTRKYILTECDTTHQDTSHDTHDTQCKCFCRHYCRFFYRIITNTTTSKDLYSTKWANKLLLDDDDDDDDVVNMKKIKINS